MPIVYANFIDVEYVRALPHDRFVFGDNVGRAGRGGQAASMRGEPNVIGIVTKWSPGRSEQDYFTDSLRAEALVINDLKKVSEALRENRTVFVPSAGIGTGLAELPQRAPQLYKLIRGFFAQYTDVGTECPWPE